MAYICDCCGKEFDEPELHYEYEEFWGHSARIEVYGCPYCGGGYQDA